MFNLLVKNCFVGDVDCYNVGDDGDGGDGGDGDDGDGGDGGGGDKLPSQ